MAIAGPARNPTAAKPASSAIVIRRTFDTSRPVATTMILHSPYGADEGSVPVGGGSLCQKPGFERSGSSWAASFNAAQTSRKTSAA